MPKILVQRRGHILVPVTPHARSVIGKMLEGEDAIVTVKLRARSARQNAFYHAIVGKVAEACGYDSPNLLHNQIKEALGLYDWMQTLDGGRMKILRSTAFEEMEPDEFKDYFDKAIDLIIRDLLPQMTRQEFAVEIKAMLGLS